MNEGLFWRLKKYIYDRRGRLNSDASEAIAIGEEELQPEQRKANVPVPKGIMKRLKRLIKSKKKEEEFDEDEVPLKDFAEYVKEYCQEGETVEGVTTKQIADIYVAIGNEILQLIKEYKDKESIHELIAKAMKDKIADIAKRFGIVDAAFIRELYFMPRDIANYINWACINCAYENNHPFGKGTFYITFSYNRTENDVCVKALLNLLRAGNEAYNRPSSHTEIGTGALNWLSGIDIDADGGGVADRFIRAFKFRTILFNGIKIGKKNDESPTAVAFKPETRSANVFRRPRESFKHAHNQYEAMYDSKTDINKMRRPRGTYTYREKLEKLFPVFKQHPNLTGNPLVMIVGAKKLGLHKDYLLERVEPTKPSQKLAKI